MRKIWRIFGEMRLADWLFFGALVPLAGLVRVSVAVLGFNRTIAQLPASPMHFDAGRVGQAQMRPYRCMMGWAYRFAPLLNCLSISIAAWWLLRRRGIVTQMRFGMAKPGERLLAHAWLEHFGYPITDEPRLAGYAVFDKPLL